MAAVPKSCRTAQASRSRPIRIGVLGAGKIGGWLGGAVARSGRVPVLVGRAWFEDAVGEYGLRLTQLDGSTTVHRDVVVSTQVSALADCDVVLVAVKSGATAAAADSLVPVLKRTAVLISAQNGLDNAATLGRAFPNHAVLGSMVSFNVVNQADHHLHQTTSGPVVIGAGPRAGELAEVLRAGGVDAQVHGDIDGVLRTKLVFNLNNALNALSGIPLRDQLLDRGYRRLLADAMDEARAVYRAAGLSTPRIGKMIPWLAPKILRLPTPVFVRVAASMIQIDPKARSSMYDDLHRRRPTEIDALNGRIVDLGREHAVPTPVNTRLVSAVKDAEQAGQGSPALTASALRSS